MLAIQNIVNAKYNANSIKKGSTNSNVNVLPNTNMQLNTVPIKSENLAAYHPSFCKQEKNAITEKEKINLVKSKLDKKSVEIFNRLRQNGILNNNNSNDGSTVLDNLYKIAAEPRIIGLSDKQILSDVLKALDNPFSITQKFGDIPNNVAEQIEQETGQRFPTKALHVSSSSCVVASMEFNLAMKNPAEFARFAEGFSGANYSVDKNIKMSDIDNNYASSVWKLNEFHTDFNIHKNWDDVTVKIQPDRNAIIRARIQTSFKDPGERSCIDVLMQSAFLNLGSQATYNALVDERTGKYNNDNSGLTDYEKTFAEAVVFGKPKVPVVYQNLDENGYLTGYNAKSDEVKNHILKSLELGENVIIGYTHINNDKKIDGGHEITVISYEKDKDGNEYFICNDTDDNIDQPIRIKVDELIPLIHHAGIPQAALGSNDTITEPWRELIAAFKSFINNKQTA